MEATKKGLRGTEEQAKTRLLLTLWDLGGGGEKVKRSELNSKVQRKDENSSHYQSIYEELQKEGAIELSMANRVGYVLLTDGGMQVLMEGLKNTDFGFDGTQVGSRVANTLLKWIRQMDGAPVAVAKTGGVAVAKEQEAIASYDKFKPVALEVYDRLNRDYNLNDLVPIYRIRKEVGDRVSRAQFNEWMLEMQANDIFELMAGEMSDITPDKRENSITVPGGGLRYYAKRQTAEI